ncbi:MAG: hypothetical protein LBH48_00220 [Bifidobacteriaceae bacterium]|nr:hypothetical protein [Bifidobacteriaceae bacterium]
MSNEEKWRASALRDRADADAFIAARLLARHSICRLRRPDAALPLRLDQSCPTCGGTDHGRPLPLHDDLHVSWAHARGVVAAAASPAPIGVDIEPLSAADQCAAVWPEEVSTPAAELLARWVEAEAAVKCGLLTLDEVLASGGPALPAGWRADHSRVCGAMAGWVTVLDAPPTDVTVYL